MFLECFHGIAGSCDVSYEFLGSLAGFGGDVQMQPFSNGILTVQDVFRRWRDRFGFAARSEGSQRHDGQHLQAGLGGVVGQMPGPKEADALRVGGQAGENLFRCHTVHERVGLLAFHHDAMEQLRRFAGDADAVAVDSRVGHRLLADGGQVPPVADVACENAANLRDRQ